MHIENIIIGKPLVDLYHLLALNKEDLSYIEITVHDNERFLPKLLVNHGFVKSTSEIKRNRMDLWRTLNKVDFEEIKIGKKKVWIVIGE